VEGSRFDEVAYFRALAASGVRALLIGRRAMVLLGLPVLTADYDFWIAIDDIAAFNLVGAGFDLHPSRPPDDARRLGRYSLANNEHMDVLVARAISPTDGPLLEFEDLWSRRREVRVGGAAVALPSIDDLIRTKQIAARPKDLEDIRLLRLLKERES
jgi:hypothetical protein